MRHDLERYWQEMAELTSSMPMGGLSRVASALFDCRRRGGTVYLVGNGGSAATASHIACDLAKGTRVAGSPHFRVVPLTDNVPLITAWANDADYARVFAEQIASLISPRDILMAISVSGNSPNILAAVEVAQRSGALTIGLTSRKGGRLRRLVDLAVCVPSDNIEQVEDAHLVIGHSLCVALRHESLVEATARSPLLVTAGDALIADSE